MQRRRTGPRRSPWTYALLGVVAVVAVVLIAAALLKGASERAAASAEAKANPAPIVTTSEDPRPLTHLTIQGAPKLLVLGDSWAYGQGADQPTDGFAYQLGRDLHWQDEVDAIRGSGYTQAGPAGPANNGSYLQRVQRMPGTLRFTPSVVMIFGSLNDSHVTLDKRQAAEERTVAAVKQKFPDAAIVLVGPVYSPAASQAVVGSVESTLWSTAAHAGAAFIDPETDGQAWFPTAADWAKYTRPDQHPGQAGHDLIAGKLVADFRSIFNQ